jgi:hypothetical protein
MNFNFIKSLSWQAVTRTRIHQFVGGTSVYRSFDCATTSKNGFKDGKVTLKQNPGY